MMTPREHKIVAILRLFLEDKHDEAEPLAREFIEQLAADHEEVGREIKAALRNKGPLTDRGLRMACAGTDRVTYDRVLGELEDANTVRRNDDDELVYDGDLGSDIRQFIETKVQGFVARHGGTVEMQAFDDGSVYVELGGGCQGCAAATVTLNHAIEKLLRREFGEAIDEVIDVTDHEAGENPYFNPEELEDA